MRKWKTGSVRTGGKSSLLSAKRHPQCRGCPGPRKRLLRMQQCTLDSTGTGCQEANTPPTSSGAAERSAGSPESGALTRRSPESRNEAMAWRSGRERDGVGMHVGGVGRDCFQNRRGTVVADPRHLLPNRVRHWARGGRRRAGLNGWGATASGSEHLSAWGTDNHVSGRERSGAGAAGRRTASGLYAILGIKSGLLRIHVCFTARPVI